MKSESRIRAVAKGVVDQINALPTKDLRLGDSGLRQAFAIYDTLQWVLGKREADRETTVADLLAGYRERSAALAASGSLSGKQR